MDEQDEQPISERLTPRIVEDWSRGVGLDYDQAEGVYRRMADDEDDA